MEESLAVLLLPSKLEQFELEPHARGLLTIPRVIALEPSRFRTPRFLRDPLVMRQAMRLRFPGVPRLLVLYHPAQYPLARALAAHHGEVEVWYVRSEPPAAVGDGEPADDELLELDQLAREHATRTLPVVPDRKPEIDESSLRLRLQELHVINHRPFLPGKASIRIR